MLKVYPYTQLGASDFGWLKAKHHFSFGGYQDKSRMSFGHLRVINDDIIESKKGFDFHPHKDMEIITYVKQGAISHEDNQGNKGRTKAGEVQVMSAGTGIIHSEYNHEAESTNILQIWIEPKEKSLQPRWEAKEFSAQENNKLNLLVSPFGEGGLPIHQDAWIYNCFLEENKIVTYDVKKQIYLICVQGEVQVEGQILKAGDGAEISDVSKLELKSTSTQTTEFLLIDTP